MMSIFEYNKLCLGLHLQLSRDLTNTSSLHFYRPSALPDAQPTVTEHWRHNIQLKYKWYINSSPSFDVFLFFDWHFMCVYSEMNTFFSTWIFSSVLSDYIFWNNTRSCEIEISQSVDSLILRSNLRSTALEILFSFHCTLEMLLPCIVVWWWLE